MSDNFEMNQDKSEIIKYYKNETWKIINKLNTLLSEAADSKLLIKLYLTEINEIGNIPYSRLDYQIFDLIK